MIAPGDPVPIERVHLAEHSVPIPSPQTRDVNDLLERLYLLGHLPDHHLVRVLGRIGEWVESVVLGHHQGGVGVEGRYGGLEVGVRSRAFLRDCEEQRALARDEGGEAQGQVSSVVRCGSRSLHLSGVRIPPGPTEQYRR